jgi:hypothetical protein
MPENSLFSVRLRTMAKSRMRLVRLLRNLSIESRIGMKECEKVITYIYWLTYVHDMKPFKLAIFGIFGAFDVKNTGKWPRFRAQKPIEFG